ncbi:MAG: hypothetical protein KDD33_03990 [Bdellovibrionales bacterium]|nr:hypothetical protein [Bdellovibrionales bacterium]
MKWIVVKTFTLCLISVGCGVKGNPLPPETPRELGTGRPQYKGVDMELQEAETRENRKKKKKGEPQK